MMIKLSAKLLVLFLLLSSGCSISPDLGSFVEKGGKAITTVQLANAGKTIADTRKIKAETTQEFYKSMGVQAATLSPKARERVMMKAMKTQQVMTRWNGFQMFIVGILMTLLIIYLAKAIRWFFPTPIEEIKKFQKKE